MASELGRDACFLAGLAKYDAAGTPHRQSIVTKLERRPDETNADFQRRMIARDLGIPG